MDICAPSKEDRKGDETCLPLNDVKNIVNTYNSSSLSDTKIEIHDDKNKMINQLHKNIDCKDDLCVIKKM